MKNIEVEVRGKIQDFDKTLEEFKQKAKFIEEKDRFSLIYFRADSPLDMETVKTEKVDLKLRITNKKPEIVLKYGFVRSTESRKEILIPISLDKFEEAVELFKFLDWYKGAIMATKTFVFNYKGIEIALVKNHIQNYFEAEKLISNKKDAEKELENIKKICSEEGLIVFTDDEFFDMMDKMNNAEGGIFDFREQNFKEIKEKFKEFF